MVVLPWAASLTPLAAMVGAERILTLMVSNSVAEMPPASK